MAIDMASVLASMAGGGQGMPMGMPGGAPAASPSEFNISPPPAMSPPPVQGGAGGADIASLLSGLASMSPETAPTTSGGTPKDNSAKIQDAINSLNDVSGQIGQETEEATILSNIVRQLTLVLEKMQGAPGSPLGAETSSIEPPKEEKKEESKPKKGKAKKEEDNNTTGIMSY